MVINMLFQGESNAPAAKIYLQLSPKVFTIFPYLVLTSFDWQIFSEWYVSMHHKTETKFKKTAKQLKHWVSSI